MREERGASDKSLRGSRGIGVWSEKRVIVKEVAQKTDVRRDM